MINNFKILTGILLLKICFQSTAQVHTNESLEKWMIGDEFHIGSSLVQLPGREEVLIANTRQRPIFLYNPTTKTVERELENAKYFAGSRLSCSADGEFVLLQELIYIDWKQNKDQQVEIEVKELSTEKSILKTGGVHDAVWHPEKNSLAVLKDHQIEIFSIPEGKKLHGFDLKNEGYSLCFTPDGSRLLVSHQPEKDDLKKVPSVRNDKKSWKPNLKYRQMISVLDSESGDLIQIIPEIYEVIYRMQISADNSRVFIYSREHSKLNSKGEVSGYISQLDLKTLEPLRTAFLTYYTEPDFKDSPDGKYFAFLNKSGYTPEIQICDRETGKILQRADLSNSLGHNIKNKEYGDGRAHFIWTSNTDLLLLYGNHLLKWKVL